MVEKNRRIQERTLCTNTWTDVSIVDNLRNNSANAPADIIKVKLENISATGVCVTSEKPFSLDQIIRFHHDLIQKTGRVVWTCQTKIECKAGIQFEQIDD